MQIEQRITSGVVALQSLCLKSWNSSWCRPAKIFLLEICAMTVLLPAMAEDPPVNIWPDVLVIDDFSAGIEKWQNEDTGKLAPGEGPEKGEKAMIWTSTDDSVGQIVLKKLDRSEVDFSKYDILMFDMKVEGRPIWNVGPILQQYPAVYGFRGFYYSVDTMHPFGKWFTYSQDLSRWENAWPDTYNTEKQEFRFEIAQLAGAGQTKISLANIRLLKNPLGVKPSYPGQWGLIPDGSQETHFEITLSNRRDRVLTVSAALDGRDPGTLKLFKLRLPEKPISLLPGETRTMNADMTVSAEDLKKINPWYGETAKVAFTVDEIPGLVIYSELVAGSRPADEAHPILLCNQARMKELQSQYADPEKRKAMPPELLRMVTVGEAALAYVPEYPPSASPGRTTDPVSGGKLQKIDVPNLPFDVYQDPISGRSYSGPLYDAGMKGWKEKHMQNAAKAQDLGVAYLISGRKEFAQAAAAILRAYIDRYLALPINCYEPGSPVGSACSGSVRIDGTYMRERIWLGDLAVALDCIRPSKMLSEKELKDIADRIFVPSAMNMMDHKVGVMNLQMMIQSSALYAGLASGEPGLVARSMYDGHGILRLIEIGYLPDGNWWENPSYQTVMNISAYPVMAICLRTGIMKPSSRIADMLTCFYRLAGPDLFTPELGTGNGGNVGLNDTAAHVFAPIIDDPRLAWVSYNRKPVSWVGELYLMAVIGGGKPLVPPEKAVSPIATATVDFPDYGGIAMRIPGTDAYAYLQYGREVTHGHLNKLSVQAYGKGGWYIRNVMGGYNHNFKDFLETIASSTSIMVDGKNANRDTGELLFKKSADGIEIASAREVAAWTDVEHERTVVLTKGPLIIIDRCKADTEHIYDWLYHSNWCGLSLESKDSLEKGPERLGDTPLYSGLIPAGKFASVGAAAWKREDGSGMKMAMQPAGDMFLTDIKDATKPSQGLVWRQKGKACYFAAALWPYAKGESGQPSLENLPVEGEGVACKVSTPEGAWTVLVNYGKGKLSAGGLETAEHVAVLFTP